MRNNEKILKNLLFCVIIYGTKEECTKVFFY